MSCILDTHTVLWFLGDVDKLSRKAYDVILNPTNKKYVSIVSAWEIAIKISLNKLDFEGGVGNFFNKVEDNGFELLRIDPKHIGELEKLPFHHRDPFDRLLIATAISENICLITADTALRKYNASCIW
ncbi:MAG: type II toxin-antitoxin system VapC family toxin [Oscillospiraceae bacterium]|nr:type II toxin-antitoxin system VapC family toxin [Oscillospiraceae bacterium]